MGVGVDGERGVRKERQALSSFAPQPGLRGAEERRSCELQQHLAPQI
jgi:hypothetical protein